MCTEGYYINYFSYHCRVGKLDKESYGFWLRKVMILISAKSRKCGAYSRQQPGGGRWVWKTELRGDSSSNKDWCVLAVVSMQLKKKTKPQTEKPKHKNIWSLNNSQKNEQCAKDFSSARQTLAYLQMMISQSKLMKWWHSGKEQLTALYRSSSVEMSDIFWQTNLKQGW